MRQAELLHFPTLKVDELFIHLQLFIVKKKDKPAHVASSSVIYAVPIFRV
jgi:hypothetical protein